MEEHITELFCFVDDFCKDLDEEYKKYIVESKKIIRKPTRTYKICCKSISKIACAVYGDQLTF